MQAEDKGLSGIIQADLQGDNHRGVEAIPGSFGIEATRDGSIKTAPAMPDQHVYIDAYFALLLTPEATPPPARSLVATAIRGLMEYNGRIGQTLDVERTPPVPPGDNQAIQQCYSI